jgi:hypothetical protein
MPNIWYYTKDRKSKHGPISDDQLRELARSGEIQPTDLVRSEGAPKWMPAARVDSLFGTSQPATAIPVSPSQAVPVPASPESGSSSVPGNLPTENHAWWMTILIEVKETGKATWGQVARLVKYGVALWRGRSIQREAISAKCALGQHMVETGQGDPEIRSQVAVLAEKISKVELAKQPTKTFQAERDSLLLRLAAQPPKQNGPNGKIEPQVARAKEAEAKCQEHTLASTAARASLFPSNSTGWRRVLTGFGAVFLLMTFPAMNEHAQKMSLEEGHRLWQAGKKTEAVAKYKSVLDNGVSSIDRSERPTIFQRVIEVEIDKGNTSAAKAIIQKARTYDVALSFNHPAAKSFLAEVQADLETDKIAQAKGSYESDRPDQPGDAKTKYDWGGGGNNKDVQKPSEKYVVQKPTEPVPTKHSAGRQTYSVSKGVLKGSITVELDETTSEEISLGGFSWNAGGDELVCKLTFHKWAGSSTTSPWRASAYDKAGARLNSTNVHFPEPLRVGETVRSEIIFLSDKSHTTKVVVESR